MYHNAGLAGTGGSSYIDSVILRDRDANTAWESQADGTLEERVYYCQNWRADVVALMTDSGELINQVRYDPYGVPFGIAKTDLDADGDVDAADYTQFSTYYSAGTMPYADWDGDGTKDTADITAYLNDKNADAGLGRGDPSYAYSTAGGANRKAYAGYEIDPVLTGSEGWESVYHVRHRVLLSQAGRWTKRDPLGYVDGMSVYGYVGAMPIVLLDSTGLRPNGGIGGGGASGQVGGAPPSFIPPQIPQKCGDWCSYLIMESRSGQCSNAKIIACGFCPWFVLDMSDPNKRALCSRYARNGGITWQNKRPCVGPCPNCDDPDGPDVYTLTMVVRIPAGSLRHPIYPGCCFTGSFKGTFQITRFEGTCEDGAPFGP